LELSTAPRVDAMEAGNRGEFLRGGKSVTFHGTTDESSVLALEGRASSPPQSSFTPLGTNRPHTSLPPGSTAAAPARPSQGDVSTIPDLLPDLTELLRANGTYEQYKKWRDGYLRWRQGGVQGVAGEINSIRADPSFQNPQKSPPSSIFKGPSRNATESFQSIDNQAFSGDAEILVPDLTAAEWNNTVVNGNFRELPEFMYPRMEVFRFHRTTSYWVATAFLEGSIIFSLTAALSYYTGGGPSGTLRTRRYVLVVVPNVIAGSFYLLGCYLAYLQLINIQNKDTPGQTSWFTLDLRRVREYMHWESIGAVLLYFAGAFFFQVCVTADLFGGMPEVMEFVLIDLTNIIGCIGFVLAAFCECLHNKFFTSVQCRDAGWWVCATFLLGCWGFFISGVGAALGLHGHMRDLVYVTPLFVGSIAFTIGSVCLFAMWKDEQYGLALMRDLNRVPIATRSQNSEDRFSVRGILFQVLHTITASFSIVSLCIGIGEAEWNLVRRWQWHLLFVHECMADVVFVLLAHVVLVFHSHVPRLPHRQPWRFVGQGLRIISSLACMSCLAQYVSLLDGGSRLPPTDPHHAGPGPGPGPEPPQESLLF